MKQKHQTFCFPINEIEIIANRKCNEIVYFPSCCSNSNIFKLTEVSPKDDSGMSGPGFSEMPPQRTAG